MTGYVGNIEEKTENNTNFREVVFTGKYCQLVVMSLAPSEEIGLETHPTVDQFFRFEEGEGKVVINGEETNVDSGFAVIVPAGAEHNVINMSGEKPLKLYTLYSPPNHPAGTIHPTKNDALKAEEEKH